MPFQLTIAEGEGSGKAFAFEQPSITIGRTDECDVVLYDPGVSRQHARIFHEGTAYFVEDMGSANGTRVNGQTVKKHQLAEGDAVSLGAVVFKFSEKEGATNGQAPGQSTRIVAASEMKRKPKAVLAPGGTSPDQIDALGRKTTRAVPTAKDEAGEAKGLATRKPDQGLGRLSAAERARIRRENPGIAGSLQVFWLDASDSLRRALVVAAGFVLLSVIAVVYYVTLYSPGKTVQKPPEPTLIALKPIRQSFGLGDDVDYRRSDAKVFDFEFNAATRAILILHYQSMDVQLDEVDVSVNGTSVGKLVPDTIASAERMNEMLLPATLVKRGERNVIAFDNVKNPPGRDPWRIWGLWLETNLLPEMPPEQLLREARDAYQRGQVAYERRDVGAESRYRAWRDFREAWLKLEAHPDPKPELYKLSRERMRESQQELDRTCKRLLLEVEAYFNQKNFRGAAETLDFVREYFPANDQPCPNLAEQKRIQHGL